MHGLEIILRNNSANQRQPHPLRLHPRIYALRQSICRMAIDGSYRVRLYDALYKYADQFVDRPVQQTTEGWDDLEALQQVTLADCMGAYLRRLASDGDHWSSTQIAIEMSLLLSENHEPTHEHSQAASR